MRRSQTWWGMALWAMVVSGCGDIADVPALDIIRDETSGERAAIAEDQLTVEGADLMTVAMATVRRADMAEELRLVGSLEGLASIEVVPDISGRLETVSVDLGDQIRAGQVVAQIRDGDLRSQVRQATNALEVSQATLRQTEVDLRLAAATRERARQLFERQLIAREALDDAEARGSGAAAQVELAKAQLAQNQARLDEAQRMLEDATVRSPVDGFVAKRHLDPGAFASSNAPVLSVVDVSRVKLVAQIVEQDARRLQVGAPTRITVDAHPGKEFTGQVARMAPVLDPVTRTTVIEIEIPNPGYLLKPGMYARIRVIADSRPNVLVVPRNAVVDQAGGRGVFTVAQSTSGEVATFVPVDTGIQAAELVEVLSGLAEGQDVVTTGAAGLSHGDLVRVVTAVAGRVAS